MNISARCPCGEQFELTHISAKFEDLAPTATKGPIPLLRKWRRDHEPHREDMLAARLDQIRNNPRHIIYATNLDDLLPDGPEPEAATHLSEKE